jgi:hypothetical protein
MAAFGGRLGLIDIKPPGALAGRAVPEQIVWANDNQHYEV